jgi:hypothetical protein
MSEVKHSYHFITFSVCVCILCIAGIISTLMYNFTDHNIFGLSKLLYVITNNWIINN